MPNTVSAAKWPVTLQAGYLTGPILALVILLCLGAVWCAVGFVHWHQWGVLVGLAGLLIVFVRSARSRPWVWPLLVVLGFACALYRPQGFSYPVWFEVSALHDNGKAFVYSPNLVKGLAGFMLLVTLLILRSASYVQGRLGFLIAAVAVVLILANAWVVLGLAWYPKGGAILGLFLVGNLLTTCVAEEAFARLLLHEPLFNGLRQLSGNKLPRWIVDGVVLLLLTALFLATHAVSSGALMWVYGVAGCLYGLVYVLTRNIYLTIGVHFGVNALHFGLLTYPL